MLLNNFGNTCYINSVLQIFINNDKFMSFITSKQYTEDNLLYYFSTLNDKTSLKKFLTLLQNKIGKKLNLNEQNDAGELYLIILDIFEKEDTFCTNYFIGKQRKIYKCTKCNIKRTKEENFTYLPIYISHTTNMESFILNFYNKEMLTLECESCKGSTVTEVKNKIINWPANLIFCINRSLFTEKNIDNFSYSRNLDFSFKNKSYKYTITGVINHIGCKEYGHYTYIKIGENIITEINDNKCRQISYFKSPLNYMLVYKCIN